MQFPRYLLSASLMVLGGLMIFTPAADAKNKKPKTPPPSDEIQVVGHVAVTGGPVRHFLATEHYSSYYLYAEQDPGQNVTLIDVTKADHPAVLADIAYAPSSASDSLTLVAGTAALVTGETAADPPPSAPQTLRIMDFSDPKNPKVAREFKGVTAMSRGNRGLIFIANADGIWILQQHLADDPELEKAYARYVIYGSSMYPPEK